MKRNKMYWELFKTFCKIGTFTFGGGYAMLSIIQREVVDKKKWISKEDFTNIITIAETTPGPVSINLATYVGYKMAGNLGAFFATLGTVFSPFLIILILSTILDIVQENTVIQSAFWGIRIGAVALIVNVLVNLYNGCSKKIYTYLTISLSFILVLFFNISSIYIILGFMLIRICTYLIKARKERI